MRNASLSHVVDENQDFRNDGSKSSRSSDARRLFLSNSVSISEDSEDGNDIFLSNFEGSSFGGSLAVNLMIRIRLTISVHTRDHSQ
jgi:hypothetical protein